MAIKIDLLPGYVKLRKNLVRSIAGCVVVVAVVFSGLALVLQQKRLDLETAKTNLATVQAIESKVKSVTASSAAAKGESAPILASVGFMTAAVRTGAQRAALLDLVRRTINENAVVSLIDISGGQKVTINATVRTPDEYAKFLTDLRRASDVQGGVLFKGLPTASGVGGFANGAVPFQMPLPTGEIVPIIYPVSITAEGTLLNPVQLPVEPGGAAAPAGDAAQPPA